MKKIIFTCIVFLCLLFPSIGYAGQEWECYHESFQITYDSNKEILRIFCDDCGETMNFDLDSSLIRTLFWD